MSNALTYRGVPVAFSEAQKERIAALRCAGKSWVAVGLALGVGPDKVRAYAKSAGLPAYLPGQTPAGASVNPKTIRHRKIRAARIEATSAAPGEARYGDDRTPLPMGSPETWGAISASPWPVYQVAT